jgi:hypothetical protein
MGPHIPKTHICAGIGTVLGASQRLLSGEEGNGEMVMQDPGNPSSKAASSYTDFLWALCRSKDLNPRPGADGQGQNMGLDFGLISESFDSRRSMGQPINGSVN